MGTEHGLQFGTKELSDVGEVFISSQPLVTNLIKACLICPMMFDARYLDSAMGN